MFLKISNNFYNGFWKKSVSKYIIYKKSYKNIIWKLLQKNRIKIITNLKKLYNNWIFIRFFEWILAKSIL